MVGEQVVAGMEGLDALLLAGGPMTSSPPIGPTRTRASMAASLDGSTACRSTWRRGALPRSTGRAPRCSAPTSAPRSPELRDRHADVHVIGSLDLVQTLLAEGLFDR